MLIQLERLKPTQCTYTVMHALEGTVILTIKDSSPPYAILAALIIQPKEVEDIFNNEAS